MALVDSTAMKLCAFVAVHRLGFRTKPIGLLKLTSVNNLMCQRGRSYMFVSVDKVWQLYRLCGSLPWLHIQFQILSRRNLVLLIGQYYGLILYTWQYYRKIVISHFSSPNFQKNQKHLKVFEERVVLNNAQNISCRTCQTLHLLFMSLSA